MRQKTEKCDFPGFIFEESRMRKAMDPQGRLDCVDVRDVQLNYQCRDEIVPVLEGLKYIYTQPDLRDEILRLVARDVNPKSRTDVGREGFSYWQILVLAAVRQGCGLNYDKLQDLAEQHRALRHIMAVGDWDEATSFDFRRIRDNVCLVRPETIQKINQLLVAEGHRLLPEAVEHIRVDSFVMETNIHYPSESTLLRDGIQKILTIVMLLSRLTGINGWRQAKHLERKTKRLSRQIERIAARKGPDYQTRLNVKYREMLGHVGKICRRAHGLRDKIAKGKYAKRLAAETDRLQHFLKLTEQVMDTARRRVLLGESVPNEDKLFSIYETHTQLYKRGKAGEPVQFGRLVLVCEDAAGFIVHDYLLPRDAQDRDVAVAVGRILRERFGDQLKSISFDRGFHSPENQQELAGLAGTVCLPKPGVKQARAQMAAATKEFRAARQRHPGIESAIGALQAGNRLERCPDRTERGFRRYLALGVLGRNLHVLGKLLIARASPESLAAMSKRKPAA
jgi:hypothetical protein